jgi:hypothetical protein
MGPSHPVVPICSSSGTKPSSALASGCSACGRPSCGTPASDAALRTSCMNGARSSCSSPCWSDNKPPTPVTWAWHRGHAGLAPHGKTRRCQGHHTAMLRPCRDSSETPIAEASSFAIALDGISKSQRSKWPWVLSVSTMGRSAGASSANACFGACSGSPLAPSSQCPQPHSHIKCSLNVLSRHPPCLQIAPSHCRSTQHAIDTCVGGKSRIVHDND